MRQGASPLQTLTHRKTMTNDKFSITIEGDAATLLKVLSEEYDLPPGEILKKAIATQMYFLDQRKQGARILILKDGDVQEVVDLQEERLG